MLKVTLRTILSSFLMGMFVASHVPHIREHAAEAVLRSRADSGLYIAPTAEDYHFHDPIQQTWMKLVFVSLRVDEQLDRAIEGCVEKKRLTAASNSDLYKQAGLPHKYTKLLGLVEQAMCRRGDFKLAAALADSALSIRSCGQYHDSNSESFFAMELMGLGKYAAARQVLQTMNAQKYEGERAYRRTMLVQSLINLHDYQGALDQLTSSDWNWEYERRYYLGEIYLGLGEWNKATSIYTQLAEHIQENARTLPEAYISLSELEPDDHALARRSTKIILNYWRELLNGQDIDEPVPGLEFAADIMKLKGFPDEAQLLLDASAKIKASDAISFKP